MPMNAIYLSVKRLSLLGLSCLHCKTRPCCSPSNTGFALYASSHLELVFPLPASLTSSESHHICELCSFTIRFESYLTRSSPVRTITAMRDENDKPSKSTKWTFEQLNAGQSVLSLQTGTNKFASQKGMSAFGSPRANIYRSEDRGFVEPDRKGEGITRAQCGTNQFASQKGSSPFLACRPNVCRVQDKQDWLLSNGDAQQRPHQSDTIIPMQAGTNKFATQTGSGGFCKQRDVILKSTGGKEIPEEMARKCDGILRLQFGTNKLANQSGMTGFGTPRSVLLKPKWKSEWIEEYEQARAEWQSQEEKRREEEHGQQATTDQRNSDDQDDSDGDEPDDDDDDNIEQIGSTVRIYGPRETETNQSDSI
ncbi:Uncharacterized protein T4E_6783 [Trichinella pseudospiralis]|uniref:Calponin-like protein OV9M n=1 Tax=Trichinella pseudospiralis TaxID=6337 RepID=A0A0V0Y8J6_TRIPS|nr:Uncharacterized protein T4E_6783 [Trichinella pseudospiralis]